MPKSSTTRTLPQHLRAAITKLGRDIAIARRRRQLTAALMAERLGVSRPTYLRIERGHPGVSLGAYAMALHTLGLGGQLADLADPGRDEQGMLLETERLPLRIRTRTDPRPL
jgi:transcriptional regulator with XRE-family HTH domain